MATREEFLGATMSKYLLLIAFTAASLLAVPATAQQSTPNQTVVTQGEVMLTAHKQRRKKRSAANRWCERQSHPAECYFCRVTSSGYCSCDYDFPCF